MKRTLIAVVSILAVAAILLAGGVRAYSTQDFTIKSFDADYYLSRNSQKTSQLQVKEKIIAEFPAYDQNHGILRAIPKSYQNHTLSLQVNSVKNQDGQPLTYKSSTQNGNLVLKIGDADKYVHGDQTYVIDYQMRNVINFLNDHQEFYWDVNGDQWPQPFNHVKGVIHIPADLASQLQDRQRCYAGTADSSYRESCQMNRLQNRDGTITISAASENLQPYETLTFVTSFKPSTFVPGPEIAHEQLIRKILYFAAGTAVLLPPAATFIFMLRRWRQFGNDPKGRGVIIPEYEPPKGFNSLSSDYLLQEKLRNLAFSAAIIEMATKRYLTIYEINQKKALRRDSKDYELLLNKTADDLSDELKEAVNLIFGGSSAGDKVKVSELKTQAKSGGLYKKLKELESSLAESLTKAGYFIKNPKKVRNGYFGWGGALAFVGFFGIFTVWTLPLAIGILFSAVILFGFAFIMSARTESGVAAHDALLGLRDYIKLAESERLRFGQSPQGAEKISAGSFDPNDPKMKVKLFETLLPYAMLFGLEKDWAKQFADIYKTAPDWYQGNWTSFNTGYLIGSIGSFSTASAQTFVSPSSSSGSGFSGGAGGGGGGGGGGGW